MNSIWYDIKSIFNHPQQGMMKIILANTLLFLVLISSKVFYLISQNIDSFQGLLPWLMLSNQYAEVAQKPWTLLTYFFVHLEIFHFIFNMAILYWFGTILSDFITERKVVQLYFLGGLAGGIFYLLIGNSFNYFIQKGPGLLNGASASIYAIVVAAATIRPNYRVAFPFLGMIPIKYISLFYVIWSFIETTGANAGGNLAHLGGAILGGLYGYQFRRNWIVYNAPKKKETVFVEIHTQKTTQKFEKLTMEDAEIEEDELNQILEKISKSGYESLSKFEKRRLFKASQKNN